MEEKKQTRMVLVMMVLMTILPLGSGYAVVKDLFEYEPGAELIGPVSYTHLTLPTTPYV